MWGAVAKGRQAHGLNFNRHIHLTERFYRPEIPASRVSLKARLDTENIEPVLAIFFLPGPPALSIFKLYRELGNVYWLRNLRCSHKMGPGLHLTDLVGRDTIGPRTSVVAMARSRHSKHSASTGHEVEAKERRNVWCEAQRSSGSEVWCHARSKPDKDGGLLRESSERKNT